MHVTLREALAYSSHRLASSSHRLTFGQCSSDSSQDAGWICSSTLGLDPLVPLSEKEMEMRLSEGQWTLLKERVEKRIRGVPTAYILNEAYLGGHCFYVDERAVIPRSYLFEYLVSQGPHADFLQRSLKWQPAHILDLCCGGGSLSILAAIRFPESSVDAVDVSADALEVAKRNVDAYGMMNQIRLIKSDLFSALQDRKYDLIICNPPYVSSSGMSTLPPEYKKEPALALYGGSRDGLALVNRILYEAPQHLNKDSGVLLLEVGYGKVDRLKRRWPSLKFHHDGAVCSLHT